MPIEGKDSLLSFQITSILMRKIQISIKKRHSANYENIGKQRDEKFSKMDAFWDHFTFHEFKWTDLWLKEGSNILRLIEFFLGIKQNKIGFFGLHLGTCILNKKETIYLFPDTLIKTTQKDKHSYENMWDFLD